jgi:plastocyanin/uncharacterized protein with PhoU and TrkA domain
MSRTIQFRRLGSATLANTTGANGELIINNTNKTLTVHDGTTPGGYALLNSATDNNIDQYARTTANTAVAGVITVNNLAQNAYNKANAAYNYANTIVSDTQIDQFARNTANTNSNNITIIQGVNTTQNTNITNATNLAQSAFDSSNTASNNISIMTGVNDTQNTRINSIETINANQNTSISIIQGVDTTQNTNITTATNLAQAAFNQANSVYLPSVTRLNTTNSGASSYLFDQYTGNNPNIFIRAGETLAFNLNVTGHPFLIRESAGGTLYNIGLTHVSTTGVVSTESSAQAQVSGTLYWKVPAALAGNTYVYQCEIHGGMVGNIVIEIPNQANSAINLAQAAYDYANTIVSDTQIDPYARTTANTASNNIIIIQGVNTTQNTNITNATNLAQSAFDSSNNRTVSSLVNGASTVSLGSTGTLTMPTGGRINFDSLSISEAVFYSPNKTVEISSGTSNVQIIATALSGRKTWSFEANGAIVFPDSSVQNTAFTGTAIDQVARNSANAAAQTIPQNIQSTNYTLQLTDAGKHIYYTQASNTILHIPTTSNVAFSNGSTIMIISATSAGANVTVSPNTGVTMYLAGNTTSASRNVTTYGMATLIQVAANTWFINGTGVS